MSATPPGWSDANRQWWDERVPLHLSSPFYDVDGFKAGRPAVEPFEIDELGALGGLRLAHLQCHFGLDTLDLVRLHPTLSAVGLDFSPPGVAAATALAEELGLADRVSFVQGEVAAATAVLGASAFDIVYTGKGALCWLPDLHQWARECWGLLRPGGWLYLCEFHPLTFALDFDAFGLGGDYFRTEPWASDSTGSYAAPATATEHNFNYCWNHPLPQVFGALLDRGFVVRFFHEWDYTLFEATRWLVRSADGRYRWPDGSPGRLPLMYSLKAFRPAA